MIVPGQQVGKFQISSYQWSHLVTKMKLLRLKRSQRKGTQELSESEKSHKTWRLGCCALFPMETLLSKCGRKALQSLQGFLHLGANKHIWVLIICTFFLKGRMRADASLSLSKVLWTPNKKSSSACFSMSTVLIGSHSVQLPSALSRWPILWATGFIGASVSYVFLVYWILASEWWRWLKSPIHHWRFAFSSLVPIYCCFSKAL